MSFSADNATSADEIEDRSVSRTAKIEQALEHLILAGELAPGERLIETDLSRRFGTSRGPLREAMQTLAAKGLVETVRNRGVIVRSVSAREAMELYDVRAAVFGLAGRLLTDRLNDIMLETMYGFVHDMEALAKARSFDDYYRKNLAFHDYLITSTGNQILAAEYRSFVNKLHLCRAKTLVQAGGLAVSNREHAEMVDAVASGDKIRAQEAFFRHVERAKIRFISTLSDKTEGIY
ncbi:FCD domain-containing protein [Paracoccus beibuensis]|uniref:FCD domain-containing protein n=1 Tax=Paracoccus beibuensis TaxID=547602 RepID=UPI00223F67C6|nr:FCD domain-containing protein [Paracoccus beibuensis]